jgi:cysteine desulfurase family protein (TIGR01976 family)
MSRFDVAYIRRQFPALARTVDGHPAAYLDGPGGTQVPQRVLDAVQRYLAQSNCNIHGVFATSEETDAMLKNAHEAFGDFLGCAWDEVGFGANMTTLTIMLAQGIGRDLKPGDEVVITQLDHEGDRGPWQLLEDRGVVVREVPVRLESCTLDWEAFERTVNARTRVVALGYASNATGTVNDVKRAAALAHSVGAWCFVDSVHYALHGAIDVKQVDCDFLACSAYKFFGPHVGVLYVRKELEERIRPLKLRPQEDWPPYRYETGTLNHEGIAGAAEAVEFIADLGRHEAAPGADVASRRRAVVAGMQAIEAYEQPLARHLIDEFGAMPGLKIYGPPEGHPRTSTVSFTLDGFTAPEVARALGRQGLFVWDGDFFATRLVELLGLESRGGMVRVGLAPYNTAEEMERVIAAVGDLARSIR